MLLVWSIAFKWIAIHKKNVEKNKRFVQVRIFQYKETKIRMKTTKTLTTPEREKKYNF